MFWRKLFCTLVILSVGLWYRQPAQAQAAVRTIPLDMKWPTMVLSPDGRTAALFEHGAFYNFKPDIVHVPIRLIDLNTGKTVQQLSDISDYATAAAFTPDGKRIVTIHSNGMIYVWDVASGKQIKVIRGFFYNIRRAEILPDGKTMIVVADVIPNQILLWDIDTGYIIGVLGPRFTSFGEFQDRMNQRLAFTDFSFAAFAVSPDGKILATATGSDEVALWDVATNKPTVVRPVSEEKGLLSIRTVVFTPDGKTLVYSDVRSKLMTFWDIASGTVSKSLPIGAALFALSPNGDTLAWVEAQISGSKVRLMKLSGESQDLTDIPASLRPIPLMTTIAFTPDGRQLVIGGFVAENENNTIYVINVGG